MKTFEGDCVGGPWDGRHLAHWSKTKALYRPTIANSFSLDIDNEPVEAVEIGEYRLNDYGQWHWWETR